MITQTVPALSFVTMGISLLFGIAIPLGLFIFYRKKYDCKIKPFITGCITFLVFAIVLESICHAIILAGGRQEFIMARPLLYGLYGGLMAGLFEETGRFLAFKTVLKDSHDTDNTALMYGAGHGGFEVFYILFASSISNIVMAAMINSGNTQLLTASLTGDKLSAMQQLIDTLVTTKPLAYCAGIIERLPAVAFHISLSLIVWFAAKNKEKWYLYPLAIILHLVLDAATATLAAYKVNVVLIEAFIYVFAIAIIFLALKIWRKNSGSNSRVDV